jgi:hypothetical protein
MKIKLFLIILSTLLIQCTNYTVTKAQSVPPTIVSVTYSTVFSGYLVSVKAINPELLFRGYRLYVGISEADSRAQNSLDTGYSCDGANQLFNIPTTYNLEVVQSDAPLNSGNSCRFKTTLTSGKYISIRSTIVGFNSTGSGIANFRLSEPSNTVIVP